MSDKDTDTAARLAAFAHIKRLNEIRDGLTASDLAEGFPFAWARIPLINPRRGIFKPAQMRYVLSIKTVFPKRGGRIWYDDQRDVHRQTFAGVDTIEYAFMGTDPNAAVGTWNKRGGGNKRLQQFCPRLGVKLCSSTDARARPHRPRRHEYARA